MPSGLDANISELIVAERNNTDLANDLGNLASCVMLEELNAALLRHDGDVGRILKYVIERGRGCTGCSLDGLDESLADNVYLAAVQWASECLDVG